MMYSPVCTWNEVVIHTEVFDFMFYLVDLKVETLNVNKNLKESEVKMIGYNYSAGWKSTQVPFQLKMPLAIQVGISNKEDKPK